MKITQNTPEKLEIKEDNIGAIILGFISLVLGIILLVAGIMLGLAIIVIGVVVVLVAKKSHIVVDKTSRTLTYSAKSLIKKTNRQLSSAEIKNVALESKTYRSRTDNGYDTNIVGNLALNLSSGESINLSVLTKKKSIFKLFQKTIIPNEEIGGQIAQAIGVPFETNTQSGPTLVKN